MVRNERQRERQQERKLERLAATTHSGYAGKSIVEKLVDSLDACVERLLFGNLNPKDKCMCRGEVRGLARAVYLMSVPNYTSPSAVEKASASRVRRIRHAEDEEQGKADESNPGSDPAGDGA